MRSVKNVQQVLMRRSFPDFLKAMNNKVDIKEWSEVGGVFSAVRSVLRNLKPDIVFEIGCGKRPTLATLLALNYKMPIVAIDPALNLDYAEGIWGLKLVPVTLQGALDNCDLLVELLDGLVSQDPATALVVANHAHCSRREILALTKMFKHWVYITVPCCVDNTLLAPALVKEDIHMHTPKNKIYTQASDKKLLSKLVEAI